MERPLTVSDSLAMATCAPPIPAGELFRWHGRFVASFLFRLGVRAQDIDDVLQEVFLVAHRRGGFVPAEASATTWLAQIALRVASTSRRARRHEGEELDEEALYERSVQQVGPERAAETSESLALVQRALDTLDISKRAVIILFELEGETCENIAAGLGIPLGTVHSRLHVARREFTKSLERLMKEKPRRTP